jgi:hypothetical protein
MQKADTLIRTKLRLPFIRLELVPRPRLQEQIAQGLRGPLTLITAPAGFGKTTLVASCVAGCGMPVAWLSLDKNDNQAGRFLNYLVAALQEADHTIGSGAAHSDPPLPLTRSMQMLLAQWLARAGSSPLRDYVIRLLSHFDAEPLVVTAAQEKAPPEYPVWQMRASSARAKLLASTDVESAH